ncbi:unnamed protein product [Porites evermanni]|uniref:Uncharacterized protein n=1 Tax=Porites evermanni TaxID=104178 RepID=A0ABN8T302_9CNID|nr:unnamed protein product [Porites evermanni]
MAIRVLFLAANLPVLFGGLIWKWEVPRNGEELTKGLKLLGLKPGPLGYFNSAYMAFTKAEADKFPNLVSYHTMLRRMKIYNITRESAQVPVQTNRSRIRRDESSDDNDWTGRSMGRAGARAGQSFPNTNSTGNCTSKTGGLCDLCPAKTDLGPDKRPQFINVMVCRGEQFCGEGNVGGLCTNSTVEQTFLREIGKPNLWETYPQKITICCECVLM